MSVTSVTELRDRASSQLRIRTASFQRRFHVQSNDQRRAVIDAEEQVGVTIPALRSVLSFQDADGATVTDKERIVDSIDFRAVSGDPKLIEVTVTYKLSDGVLINPDDPIKDDPVLSVTSYETQEPVFLDINGSPIQNTAGETFDPPLTEVYADQQVEILVNRPDTGLYDQMAFVANYNNKLNSDLWEGVKPRQGWMRVRCNRSIRNQIPYWATTFSILIRAEGWDRQVLNEGFKKRQFLYSEEAPEGESGFFLEEITDHNNRQMNTPVKLDAAGQPLRDGDPPIILTFQTKRAVQFGSILGQYNLGPITP